MEKIADFKIIFGLLPVFAVALYPVFYCIIDGVSKRKSAAEIVDSIFDFDLFE